MWDRIRPYKIEEGYFRFFSSRKCQTSRGPFFNFFSLLFSFLWEVQREDLELFSDTKILILQDPNKLRIFDAAGCCSPFVSVTSQLPFLIAISVQSVTQSLRSRVGISSHHFVTTACWSASFKPSNAVPTSLHSMLADSYHRRIFPLNWWCTNPRDLQSPGLGFSWGGLEGFIWISTSKTKSSVSSIVSSLFLFIIFFRKFTTWCRML